MGGRNIFFIRGGVDPKDLEAECSDCSHSKFIGPEVGTWFRCWRQNDEGGVARAGEGGGK